MKKLVFSSQEAKTLCFNDSNELLNLELFNWEKSGDLIRLKRGLYAFADTKISKKEIAENIYGPCYFSLEYALSSYNILPEAAFTYTLVTTRQTRQFVTPLGTFNFQTIKPEAFTGYDPQTLMAEKEKALVDWFYLNGHKFRENDLFWRELRLETKETGFNFTKAAAFAKIFKNKKLEKLLTSFINYAKSH